MVPSSNPEAGSFCKSEKSPNPEAGSFCKTAQPAPQMRNRDQVIGSKTPRNAPCPCGSGSKFKKCCGPGKFRSQRRRNTPQPGRLTPIQTSNP
jgi:hypothetical protein